MAVEQMEMMNLVGPIEDIHHIAKEIVQLGNVHMVNASHEIDESNFTLNVLEENIDELIDMCIIKPYQEESSHKNITIKINNMMQYFEMKPIIREKYFQGAYDFQDTYEEINEIYNEVHNIYEKIMHLEEELQRLQEFDHHIKHLKGLQVDLDQLNDLHFFNYKIGILSKENRLKLKKNYENISAIVLHIGSNHVGEVYMIISTKELATETDRILRSLHFQELNMPKEFSGTPQEVQLKIEKKEEILSKDREDAYKVLKLYKQQYESIVEKAYSRLKMEEEMTKIKNETACTNNFFYLSGWVPKREKKHIQERFAKYGDRVIIIFKETSEVNKYIIPPTKLTNNWFTRAFEPLVKMYGVPSYDELDPTVFLSITYMILFGAMFGDVGQGCILFLLGMYFKNKEDTKVFGNIFARLGLSSSIFGLLYGSIFGFEHLIPALLIRPIENIDEMLAASVIMGTGFLIVSFIYGIINAMKQKNIKEGLFGRNGLTGFLFYVMFLVLLFNLFMGKAFISNKICYSVMGLLMGIMVIREPLANWLMKKRPLYEENPSSYYTESGFEILETLLNMLSSTVSFIRVGAFALNHVGLFIAFHTMAEIANNFAGSIMIYMIGNIIVIGLEGLIVFIQGLRLEYYEMFSKYYKGEGVDFNPVRLNLERATPFVEDL
ncbi:V-type ATPase 116kDa subunit family protein [Clostridiaceae bacterium 35-E11]